MSRDSATKRNEQILSELLKEEPNRQCADCGQKGTRWASWSIGIFVCIRCGGLHRKLGTHISRVKSVTLDTWSDEEVKSKGNARVNAVYIPDPSRCPFPTYVADQEQYIRDKYERKLFMSNGQRGSTGLLPTGSSTGAMSLGSQARRSFALEEPPVKSYAVELAQLNEMGFTDRARCLVLLKANNGNVAECIDKLSSGATSPVAKRDSYADLLDGGFSSLKLGNPEIPKPAVSATDGNDWTDFDEPSALESAHAPGAQEPVAAPAVPRTAPAPADPWTSPSTTASTNLSPFMGSSNPPSNPEPTNPPPSLGSTNLSSVLGSGGFFGQEEDPFSDLTHNPFK